MKKLTLKSKRCIRMAYYCYDLIITSENSLCVSELALPAWTARSSPRKLMTDTNHSTAEVSWDVLESHQVPLLSLLAFPRNRPS